MYIIRWPLREEIGAYVIQLRSKAVFKLGWPPRVRKQEIISKAQRKIPACFCPSPSTSLFPMPEALPQHLQFCWLWKLCEKGNLWFQISESESVGVNRSRVWGKKTPNNKQILNPIKANPAYKVCELLSWRNGPEATVGAATCWGHQILPPRRPQCTRATLAALWCPGLPPSPRAQGLRRVLKKPCCYVEALKIFVRKF